MLEPFAKSIEQETFCADTVYLITTKQTLDYLERELIKKRIVEFHKSHKNYAY